MALGFAVTVGLLGPVIAGAELRLLGLGLAALGLGIGLALLGKEQAHER